jgi:hypothetical protein
MNDQLGHLHNEARALHHLGLVELAEGSVGAAKDHFKRSLDICRRTGAAPLALDVLLGWSVFEADAKKLDCSPWCIGTPAPPTTREQRPRTSWPSWRPPTACTSTYQTCGKSSAIWRERRG